MHYQTNTHNTLIFNTIHPYIGGYYTPIRNLIYTTLIINILQTPLLYKICEKKLDICIF